MCGCHLPSDPRLLNMPRQSGGRRDPLSIPLFKDPVIIPRTCCTAHLEGFDLGVDANHHSGHSAFCFEVSHQLA